MFGLVVRFELKPGAGEAFDRLARQTLAQVRQHEAGTLVYACHQVTGAPDARIFYELYASRDAFNDHEHRDYVQQFLAQREQHLAGPVRVETLTLQDGKGIPSPDGSRAAR